MFKNNSRNKENRTDNVATDFFGHAIPDNQNSLTAGANGPLLLQDNFLHLKLSHFARERIPERVVHAKGAGAHGFFEMTSNILSQHCKAHFLKKGQRTPVFTRFSTTTGDKGSSDTIRDPRGMAIKFYTDEGIQDMVCLSFPIFFNRDGMKGPDVVRALKRNPESGLFRDPNMYWDLFSNMPESIHALTMLFTDRGTPYSYRQMSSWYGHTLKLVNDKGESVWAKFRFKPTEEVKNLTDEQASWIGGQDSDFLSRDLFTHLSSGKVAQWKMLVQIIPYDAPNTYKYDIFDITKVVLHKDFPEIEVGTLTLNRNPENYFAEVEQAAFLPSNMVPGIEPSFDRLLQARMFLYRDAQLHRLGPNYHLLPINSPNYMGHLHNKINGYQRDGQMQTSDNFKKLPNYEPNSFGGPLELPKLKESQTIIPGVVSTLRVPKQHPNDDFEQCRLLYKQVLTETERENLIKNIAKDLSKANKEIQLRMIELFNKVDAEYGARVRTAITILDLTPGWSEKKMKMEMENIPFGTKHTLSELKTSPT